MTYLGSMKLDRSLILAIAGLAVLTILAVMDKVAAEAVVTFLGGLLLDRPSMEADDAGHAE